MGRVLIISPSLKVGGIEKALSVLANEFVKLNIEVFFVPCLPGKAHYVLSGDVKVIWSEISYKKGKLAKILFYSRLLLFIRKVTMKVNPDTILSFGDAFNPLVLLALLGTKNNIYISDRTSPVFKINPIARILKKALYATSVGFIAQTDRVAKVQKERFGNRLNITIIPNAIALINSREETKKKESILYVGRMSEEKGVDRLIKAFAAIDNKKWYLDLVGEGPMDKRLRQIVDNFDCTNRVTFHGTTKDPSRYYLSSSIFVLPSHVEGFPNALCEAMSAALPVICFESIPYQSILKPNISGVIVKKDDVRDLTIQLNELIRNPKKRLFLGKNAKSVVKKFRSDIIALEYLTFMGLK